MVPNWTAIGRGCPFGSRHAIFVRRGLFLHPVRGEAYKLHLSLSVILDRYSIGCFQVTGRIPDIEESLVRLLGLAIFLGCDQEF